MSNSFIARQADRLSDPDQAAVRRLLADVEHADGHSAVSEDGMLRLSTAESTHILLTESQPDADAKNESPIAGYGQVTISGGDQEQDQEQDREAVAEFAVRPGSRRRGAGRHLLTEIERTAREAGAHQLHIWAHGDHPGANALAGDEYTRDRTLWQLRTKLVMGENALAIDPESAFAKNGFALRAFRPGVDGRRWLELNSQAFADHPEQGGWTTNDLAARLAEPWFRADGFLLVERVSDGELAGFHWTKIHPDGIGEVYVLGLAPWAQGSGLATPLTVAGLRHLYDVGIREVLLYVDDSHVRAVKLYKHLGFTEFRADIQFRRALR